MLWLWPQPEKPCAESVLIVGRFGNLSGAVFKLKRLSVDCQTKLNIGFYLACVVVELKHLNSTVPFVNTLCRLQHLC